MIVIGIVVGPGTVNCFQQSDFSACMGETFLGNGITEIAEAEPTSDVAALAEPQPEQAEEPEPAQEPIAEEQPSVQMADGETAESVSEAVLPSFGLVRVEPDGAAVIAGTATPDGEVHIFADDERIGTETAEHTGDFAFVTDDPLPAGGVELRVLDVETGAYAEESVVVVVQDDRTSEPIVIASEPGEASQILQGLEQPQAVAEAEAPETDAVADEASVAEEEAGAEEEAVAETPAAPQQEGVAEVAPPSVPETESMVVADVDEPAVPVEIVPATPQVAPQSNAPAPAEPAAEAPGTPAGETATIAPPQPTPGGVTPQVEMPSPAELADNQVAPAAPAPEAPVAPMAAPEPQAQEPEAREPAVEAAAPEPQQTAAPRPEAPAEVESPDEPATPPETTPAEPVMPEQDEPAAEPEANEQQVAERQPVTEPEATATTAQPEVRLVQPTIDAVEIDGDRNFFAGAGTDGMTVRLYVDNELVGTTQVADGRWLVETIGVLEQETQRVRIDMLGPDGAVVGRAEVDFVLDLPESVDEEIAVADTTPPGPAAETTAEAEAPAEPVEPVPAIEPEPTEPEAPAPAEPADVTEPAAEQQPAEQPAAEAEQPATEVEPAEREVPTLIGITEGGRTTSGLAIIRSGDNLWTIARRVYGEGIRYTQIFEANTDQIRDPDLIYPGQVFDLPETDQVIGQDDTAASVEE
ncbi:LysM peptidoglycan-binding domain-containing protein [Pelagibacterium mangrovi]|uniref:LysM peptidoglycan-binding domain-containing protein n=1 Tax=Pelagibacterium mangrovi TaxID=3119828 RepID=UPI002FC9DED0